jgi:serine/threonine kinase PknH
MSDAQGSRVGTMFGPYHLTRLLGRGGMGEVYEAEHTVKEWTVAVKLMSENFSKDPVFRERMKREARITGRLQEPHVVPIHDYGEIDGQMFLEMRLIEGVDLDTVLKRFGPLTPARAVAIITQVASALDAAHAAGVTHRDIKPPNVLVTRDDFAYLVDFGIASAKTDEKLTQLGTAVGTWKYMAPERFSNDEVTYRADIYALACVLHECLTGTPPYKSESATTLVTAHLMEPIPQPSTARPGIPRAFDAVVARGMAKKPEDRYASAGDLAMAAHDALSNPDQDQAANILRRSQEATMIVPETGTMEPTMAAPSAPLQQPPTPAPPSLPWAAADPFSSGPMPGASQPTPQYFQGGGNWGGAPPGGPPPVQHAGPASWNQAPASLAPKKRNPWPIIAAVAIVLVLVVGGVGIWLMTKPKPVKTPDPIQSERLGALLVSPQEVNGIMGSSGMQPGKPITAMDSSPVTVSPSPCLGALYTTQDSVYAGTGYTGMNGVVSSEPGENYDHWVNQAVVLFPSADKAKEFLQSSADKWKSCANKTVSVTNTNKGKTYRWSLADINGEPPKFSVVELQEAADGWGCERALGVANNVVADVNACAYHVDKDQAGQLVDKIVERINSD